MYSSSVRYCTLYTRIASSMTIFPPSVRTLIQDIRPQNSVLSVDDLAWPEGVSLEIWVESRVWYNMIPATLRWLCW